MVNENFKIDLEVELNQKSLADIVKQVEREISKGFSKSIARATGRQGPRGTTPAGGGVGAARSARDATSAGTKDFTNALAKATRENQKTSAVVIAALNRVRIAFLAGPTMAPMGSNAG